MRLSALITNPSFNLLVTNLEQRYNVMTSTITKGVNRLVYKNALSSGFTRHVHPARKLGDITVGATIGSDK